VNPAAEAVIVALFVDVPAVTWNVAVVACGSTVTLAGTEATLELLLERVTTWPLAPAAAFKVTLIVPLELASKFKGSGESTIGATAVVIVRV
jgi:hypothetical protein